MNKYASKVMAIAEAEVGYLEKASNSQLDSKTANAGSNNYTKYARDLDAIPGFYNGKKNGYPWCDIFVDWCLVQAFGVETAKDLLCQPNNSCGAGCGYSMQYYKNKGQFYTKNPQPGDQIFFWENNKTEVGHTGLVYAVDNTYVYTIEGNTSGTSGVVANGGGVFKKQYSLSYALICGYGRPKYDAEPVAKKSVAEVAQEVLDGKWGNGDDRKSKLTAAGYNYAEVQNAVNNLCAGKTSTKKTVEEIAKEVLDGKWDNGAARKSKLEAAGYNYNDVQKAVNALVSGKQNTIPTKSVEQIAREVIQGKWGVGADRKKRLEAAGHNYTEVQRMVNKLL